MLLLLRLSMQLLYCQRGEGTLPLDDDDDDEVFF